MINLGAYVKGSNPQLDLAVALHPELEKFLVQGVGDKSDLKATLDKIAALAAHVK